MTAKHRIAGNHVKFAPNAEPVDPDSMVIFGPFLANSGSIANGAESTSTVTHNLNLNTGTMTAIVSGSLRDGTYAGRFMWRATIAASSVTITFFNAAGATGQAFLDFYLIAFRPYGSTGNTPPLPL